jgi:glycosyltransferase involved in cell wall biosynthesis
MKPPHVVMVSQNASLELDMRPRREAETLAAAGYRVTLVGGCGAPERVRQVTAPDVNLELYPQPSGGIGVSGQICEQSQATGRAMMAVRRATRRAPVAVVHAGNPPDNVFPARRLLRLLQEFTPRFVFDQHDAAPLLLREKFARTPLARPLMAAARAIERRSFAAAGLVVFANEGYRARAVREGLLRGDSEVVLNGWSLPSVPADPHWRGGRDHVLAYVGTISEQDNVDHLVDAVAVLQARRSLRLVVAGDGSALAAVKQRARERHLTGSIEWLGLVRERARIAALVRAADVCVAPEIDSTFNRLATFVKIIEYMSAGAAVVAHRLPQTEALAGDTIRYAPDMSAEGLAAAIDGLLDVPGQRRALGAAARGRFDERISWERVGARRLVAGYERLFG